MPIFETTASSDPLGLWETTPQTVSFDLGDATAAEADGPVYRVNLPADMEASSITLAENLANYERMNAALDAVPSRLDGFMQWTQHIQRQAASGVSFTVTATDQESDPENELFSLLAMTDAAAAGEATPGEVSFGLTDVADEVLAQAKEKLEALIGGVNREILHFAWVETVIASQVIARTEVNWGGDTVTFFNEATSPAQISLHQRTLQAVSLTRNLKLRLIFTITGGAAKLATLMVTPGGAVLALPAVYHYVIRILDQVKQLKSIQST